jgi:hypothetical protein
MQGQQILAVLFQHAGCPIASRARPETFRMLQTQGLAASITTLEQRRDKEMPLQAQLNGIESTPLQRQPVPEEDEENKPIQLRSDGSLFNSFEAGNGVEFRINQSKGGGSPLPDSVRAFMEPRFGMDFSRVRAHTGSDAIQMNHDMGAKAFTLGSDNYYDAGHNPTNLELTAHELTHVVQQTGIVPLQTM